MPASAPPAGAAVATELAALGARIRARRKALKVSATATAEAAGISRVTLYRIEKGEPSVAMAAYMSAIVAVGLKLEVIDPHAPLKTLPKVVKIADYPQLKKLAWQLKDKTALKPRAALELYERNWRHVDESALGDDERALIQSLVAAFGGKRLLV